MPTPPRPHDQHRHRRRRKPYHTKAVNDALALELAESHQHVKAKGQYWARVIGGQVQAGFSAAEVAALQAKVAGWIRDRIGAPDPYRSLSPIEE